jgi:hypothetical protein
LAISFQILSARGLVYVRYDGVITLTDSAAAFAAYMQDPAFRPGQKQLVDLAAATGWEADYPRLMALQAEKAEALVVPGHETLFVYHAPDDTTRAIARMVLRSWEDVDAVVPLNIDKEADALAVLGQPERCFADLLANADAPD